MSFDSIDGVLHQLQAQNSWQGYKQFQELCHIWLEVVEPAVVTQTRPVAIVRDVLQVATSSSVWVQELNFKRYRILEQLNSHLSNPLKDIRFSTAFWQSRRADGGGMVSSPRALWLNHPSRLPESASRQRGGVSPQSPQQAFQQWRDRTQSRSQSLPLCPQCNAPTPPGELERWSICALCAARQWHKPAQFTV